MPIRTTPLQYRQAEAERTSACGMWHIFQEDIEDGKGDHDESIYTTKSYRVVSHGAWYNLWVDDTTPGWMVVLARGFAHTVDFLVQIHSLV